jgi:DNA-binding NtrC family response regulator
MTTAAREVRRKKRILVIEDDRTLNRLIIDQLVRLGFEARGVFQKKEALETLAEFEPAVIILDMRLPDADGMSLLPSLAEICPVVILTAYGSIGQAVSAVKAGASDYLIKPTSPQSLELAVTRALDNAALKRNAEFWQAQAEKPGWLGMVGESKAIDKVRDLIALVAKADTTVLIEGESGVGKELVAQSVHMASDRSSAHFVAIDCTTLQENLFESELFGHERGAFTGADRRKEGLIEVAEGGTVFLDEIGEIGPTIQAKLLRVLETGRFRRVGGTRDLTANVRFVAATNRDLRAMAESGRFRIDLFYRLSPFIIRVPPLHERKSDIPQLAKYFLETRKFSRNVTKTFTPASLKALSNYSWPGNIRELRNVVERAFLISANSSRILPEHIGLPESGNDGASIDLSFQHEPTMNELRDAYLARLLERHDGNRKTVSRALGISERNTYRLIRNLRKAPCE